MGADGIGSVMDHSAVLFPLLIALILNKTELLNQCNFLNYNTIANYKLFFKGFTSIFTAPLYLRSIYYQGFKILILGLMYKETCVKRSFQICLMKIGLPFYTEMSLIPGKARYIRS